MKCKSGDNNEVDWKRDPTGELCKKCIEAVREIQHYSIKESLETYINKLREDFENDQDKE